MSGRKTTYTRVDTAELARLRQAAGQAASLAESNRAMQRLGAATDALIRDQQNRLNSLNQTVANLNRALQNQAATHSQERAALRSALQHSIRDSNQLIQATAAEHRAQMETLERGFQQQMRQQRQDTARMIEENNRRVREEVQNATRAMDRRLGEVSGRMDDVEGDLAQQGRDLNILLTSNGALLELAREYAGAARVIQGEIAAGFRAEVLLPGRLAAVQSLVEQAEGEIADTEKMPTNAPVARLSARQAAQAARQLYEDMVRAEQAWQAAYQAARQAVNAAGAQCEASRLVKFPGENAEVDVDRWSNGDLTALRQRVDALQAQLDRPDGLTAAQLEQISQAGGQAAREAVESTQFAVVAYGASQDRADVAQDVADHMREALGLVIQSRGYQSGDQRGAHRLHLKNPVTGFEMVVTQYPETGEDGCVSNRLESDILDYGTNNEEEGDQVARQALESLSGPGLRQGQVETVSGYERRPSQRRELADQAAWQREPAAIPGPVHTGTRPAV